MGVHVLMSYAYTSTQRRGLSNCSRRMVVSEKRRLTLVTHVVQLGCQYSVIKCCRLYTECILCMCYICSAYSVVDTQRVRGEHPFESTLSFVLHNFLYFSSFS
jgi:hypothetical protein